jgi:acyl dehydratase
MAPDSRLEPGTELPAQRYVVTRADLVRYAGAALDHNPIHWSDRVAAKVGLPGVIAHGMYTMALAARALTTWAGDPAAVRDFSVRFTRPVVVPDDDTGAEVVVSGVVRRITDEGDLQVEITALSAGERVLGQARAVIRTATAPADQPATGP